MVQGCWRMNDLKLDGISVEQREIIKGQIGREPDNLLGILRYCPFNQPAVLLTHPYRPGKGVFPTSYWLSCPYLVRAVSRLEAGGMIKELSELLRQDQEFRAKLARSHQAYAKLRYSLLTKEERALITNNFPNLLGVLQGSGVGGIVEQKGIKCLHAHLADYLITGENPVGKLVWARLNWPEQCQICQNGADRGETGCD